ncbi:MAG: hypothetical protein HZA01_06320 [Nitrospinae bacterium]|nr:hypothetical protein [Nitrospinota bacterium]
MAQESIKILLAVKDQNLGETIKLLLNEQLGLWDIEITDPGPGVIEKIKASSGKSAGMSALLGGLTATNAPSQPSCGFNLLIMDWHLDEGEFASLKEIRKLHDRKTLPALLITKDRNEQEIRAAILAGANNFLFVPITADLLNARFKDVLGKKHDFKAQAALSVFQKQEGGQKKEDKKNKERKQQILTGGASYHSKKEVSEEEARFAVSRFLAPDEKINGHFHRMVDVVGGGRNCFWAREGDTEAGGTPVELQYVTPAGNSSGIHADTISKSRFMETFYICTEENCSIMRSKSSNGLSQSQASAGPDQTQTSKLPLHVHEIMDDGKRSSACYLAERKSGNGKPIMSINYMSSSERTLGHAKNVDIDYFQKRFLECTPLNCAVLKKKEEQKQLEERAKKERLAAAPEVKAGVAPSPAIPVVETPRDEGPPINGHYQEKLKGGGTNCMWAKEIVRDGKKIIETFIMSAKGKSTGIHDSYVGMEEFKNRFTPCSRDNCGIMKRLD